MAAHILVVDGDELLRHSLADQLKGQGFTAGQASSASTALKGAPRADLLLIDAGLAGALGLVGELQRRGCRQPIIVLGVEGTDSEPFRQSGARECLGKPYRLNILVGRIEALLRAPPPEEDAPRFGPFRFLRQSRLMVDGQGGTIRLTEKETAILAYLHGAGSRVVPRQELLGEVWGYAEAVSTHTVETHMYRLRRKLEGAAAALIITEDGGYRLADDAAA